MTYLPDRKVQEVQELLNNGASQKETADSSGVAERTIRYWIQRGILQPPSHKEREKAVRASADAPALSPWPEDRQWPGWTPEELERKVGWGRQQTAEEVAAIRTVERMGNRHYPWYMRLMVEVAERHGASQQRPDKHRDPWLLAVAGLLVLGDWLDSPACAELAGLIETHKPWESKASRRAYAHAARPLVDAILLAMSQAILNWRMRAAQKGEGVGLQESPPLLLQALSERIPMLDRRPFFSPFKLYGLRHLFAKLFIFPKGGAI
jgi:hypothetical protein